MTSGEFYDVLWGPLDGSQMEYTEETREGFTFVSTVHAYRYGLYQTKPKKGDFIVKRRYILEEVISGKRKTKREKGGT